MPAIGSENDDHNPPRIASQSLFDLSLGHDNLFHGDKYKWSAQLTVINLANNYALYNFLSTFSGTHYVAPRSWDSTSETAGWPMTVVVVKSYCPDLPGGCRSRSYYKVGELRFGASA